MMSATETRAAERAPSSTEIGPSEDTARCKEETLAAEPKAAEQARGNAVTDDKEIEARYTQFIESAWQHYAQAKRETHKELDGYLLKFAAGAFALSLTPAVLQLGSKQAGKLLLLGAWVAFGVTICTTLLSFLASARACERQIVISQAVMVERKTLKEAGPNKPLELTRHLNWASIGAFLIGTGFFAAYLWHNF